VLRLAGVWQGNDYEKVFGHNVSALGEALDEFDILASLDFHQVVGLLLLAALEESDVGSDVELSGLDDYFYGEIERIEEILELKDDGTLLILGFEGEVQGGGQ